MSVLRIFLFGHVRICHDGHPNVADLKLTRSVQSLLAYLLLLRCRIDTRDVLANLFWGEYSQERARSCLNTALWRLRRALEPAGIIQGTYLLTPPQGGVSFNCESPFWLDVSAFESQVSRFLSCPLQTVSSGEAAATEEALELHSAELLEGFYDDWVVSERERLNCLYVDGLARVMRYHIHQQNHEQGLGYGQRILRHDALREDVHREMMRLYMETGQRPLALRQYEACCSALKSELGVEPMPETQSLYSSIKSGDGDRLDISCPSPLAATASAQSQSLATTNGHQTDALRQFQNAMRTFDEAWAQLKTAMLQLVQTAGLDGEDSQA